VPNYTKALRKGGFCRVIILGMNHFMLVYRLVSAVDQTYQEYYKGKDENSNALLYELAEGEFEVSEESVRETFKKTYPQYARVDFDVALKDAVTQGYIKRVPQGANPRLELLSEGRMFVAKSFGIPLRAISEAVNHVKGLGIVLSLVISASALIVAVIALNTD